MLYLNSGGRFCSFLGEGGGRGFLKQNFVCFFGVKSAADTHVNFSKNNHYLEFQRDATDITLNY